MMAAVLIGAFGGLVGSFLNVVVYRVPRGMSVAFPPSACGACEHAIRPYDNIPVVSWLLLRGRCRDCGSRISLRYPLVELGGAIAFGLVAWRFLADLAAATTGALAVAAALQLVAYLYLVSISVALALIDLDTRRLPDAIVLPAYPVAAVLLGVAAVLAGDLGAAFTALLGAFALGGVYLVLAVARPGGMGMGDVKLAGVLGLFLGWLGIPTLLVGAVGASLIGGVVAAVLLIAGRAKEPVPFGPILLAGAWLGILLGDQIAAGYLAVFGLT